MTNKICICFNDFFKVANLSRSYLEIEPAKMDDADLGAVATVDITLSSGDNPENVDSVKRFEIFFNFLNS